MKSKKCTTILVITLFLLMSCAPAISAEAPQNNQNDRIVDKTFIKFFSWAHESMLGPILFSPFSTSWKAFRFAEPPFFTAVPETIDFECLNKTEITIGMPDSETGGFRTDYEKQLVAENEYYEFNLEFPDGVDENAWFCTFDPQTLYPKKGEEVKTELTVYSTQPDYKLPPTGLILIVNVTRHLTYGNLYFPPKGQWMFQGGNFSAPFWFIGAVSSFGKYSGTDETMSVEVKIMVRANRFHLAEITTPKTMEIGPNKLVSIPVEIKNQGTYVDSFNFRVNTDSDCELIVSPPSAITLNPNEIKTVYIGVASPRNFNDPGTLHNIRIEAYSVYDPDNTFNNTVSIVTRGIYVSEAYAFYSASFGIIILLGVILFLYRRRKIFQKLCIKPDEPWELEKEKRCLDKLKEKDKEKYDETMKMMKDEYKSSLLWYKHYCKDMLKKSKEIDAKTSSLPSKKSNKPEIKQKTQPKEPEHKPKRHEKTKDETERQMVKEEMPEKQEQKNDETSELEKQKRNQATLKIKKAQEKQRRKLKL